MVLSELEKHGLTELLNGMTISDLISLAQTCTSRFIMPETTSEAIEAILLHTSTTEELLKRKKVKKELLFKYLHSKSVEGVTLSLDKLAIVVKVLQLWHSPQTTSYISSKRICCSNFNNEFSQEDSCSLPEAPAPSRNASYSSLLDLQVKEDNQIPSNFGLLLNKGKSTSGSVLPTENGTVLGSCESSWSMATEEDSSSSLTQRLSNQPTVYGGLRQSLASATNSQSLSMENLHHQQQQQTPFTSLGDHQAQLLANKFVCWFYDLLNSVTSVDGGVEFTSDHFWHDASAKIGLINNPGLGETAAAAPPEMFHVQNAGKEVCSVITNIVRKYSLVFNPNICNEGVSGKIDSHGLALVSACGTLHTASQNGSNCDSICCGTFLQVFGLIRDPFEGNNWKIKFTQAEMVSKAMVERIPSLSGEADGLLLEWAKQQHYLGTRPSSSSSDGEATAMAIV